MVQGGKDVIVVRIVDAFPFVSFVEGFVAIHVPQYFNETVIFFDCERLLMSPVQVLLGDILDFGVPRRRTNSGGGRGGGTGRWRGVVVLPHRRRPGCCGGRRLPVRRRAVRAYQ